MKSVYTHWPILAAFLAASLMTAGCGKTQSEDGAAVGERAAAADSPAARSSGEGTALPKLLDLGAHSCIPCKMMAPILEELTNEYKGRMEVEFIDVWQNPEAGQEYGVRTIPTQIFYGSDGRQLFRHEGFYSKEDILSKWAEYGYTFTETDEEE